MKGRTPISVYAFATQRGFPYIDTHVGRVAQDGKTWLVRHCEDSARTTGQLFGHNGKYFVIEGDDPCESIETVVAERDTLRASLDEAVALLRGDGGNIDASHDRLSVLLENSDAANDDIRDAAISLCETLVIAEHNRSAFLARIDGARDPIHDNPAISFDADGEPRIDGGV